MKLKLWIPSLLYVFIIKLSEIQFHVVFSFIISLYNATYFPRLYKKIDNDKNRCIILDLMPCLCCA